MSNQSGTPSLQELLVEMKLMKMHLAVISGANFTEQDIEEGQR